MKTFKLLPLIFLLSISLQGFAQTDQGFGIKAGINYGSTGDLKDDINSVSENPDANIGYHVGIFNKIHVGQLFYIRPELVYTKTSSGFEIIDFEVEKIDLPVLLGLHIFKPIHAFVGPSFQYILNTDLENTSLGDVANDLTVGLHAGIGVNIGNIGLDLRYELGLSNNEVAVLLDNQIRVGRIDTKPSQLILSLSLKI